MSAPSVAAPALFRHRPFVLYFWARGTAEFAHQIAAVAVGWQVYALTGSAFDLGLVGLAQFVPTLILVFVAGHVADRHDRRRVVQLCQIVEALAAAFLAWASIAGTITVGEILGAVAVFGAAIAFEGPAAAALIPAVSPDGLVQKATALTTAAFQAAMIAGPALGGLAYVLGAGAAYGAMTALWAAAALLNGGIALARQAGDTEKPTLRQFFAGIGFVRQNKPILGAISLDLFAVLLGGATALLPIYARDILHTGPWGLGVLRGAPAVGALVMAAALSRYAIERRAGLRMFQAVIAFGAATVVFALSHALWLSLLALAAMGASDTVSMVIRIALVQLRAPDAMRGRVGAVNYLFVNTSYQLGEFESGVTAALLGAVPAAALGGIGTIAVALLWMKLFPALKDVERLE